MILDLRRAREWTDALARWCEAQPDLVPFRGQCLVHRAQIMTLTGAWQTAMDEAERACERLAARHDPAIGDALYEQAELHRLRGDFSAAETLYVEAGEHGREPQPGLALVRLAQGQHAAALAALRRVLAEDRAPTERGRILAPYVEIGPRRGRPHRGQRRGDRAHRRSRAPLGCHFFTRWQQAHPVPSRWPTEPRRPPSTSSARRGPPGATSTWCTRRRAAACSSRSRAASSAMRTPR